MPERILTVDHIHAGYGGVEVLSGVSLEVNRGEIVALIGANGAGKTSTLLCISGLLKLRAGEISFEEQDIAKIPAHALVKLGIAQVPEGRKIFPRLSVIENLQMGAFTRDNDAEIRQDLERVFSLFPILKDRRDQSGGTLSGGEQQMLAIARALMSRPKLLLLDEPSMGVAPLVAAKIFETLKLLNSDGMTMLLVEQNAKSALRLAERAYVLETGRITLQGTGAELLGNAQVQAAYLGG